MDNFKTFCLAALAVLSLSMIYSLCVVDGFDTRITALEQASSVPVDTLFVKTIRVYTYLDQQYIMIGNNLVNVKDMERVDK
jgi:hypothetical protein